jgi:hypothetical protein
LDCRPQVKLIARREGAKRNTIAGDRQLSSFARAGRLRLNNYRTMIVIGFDLVATPRLSVATAVIVYVPGLTLPCEYV